MTDWHQQLLDRWTRVAASEPSGREWRAVALSIPGSLHILAGIREPDNRIALLLEAPISEAPKDPVRFSTAGLSLADQRRRDEGLFRLAIVLERPEMQEIFEVLATDVVSVASQAADTKAAILSVIRRLEAWQACLRSGRRGLTPEAQIGLFGELVVLELLAQLLGYTAAVGAWGGPLDEVHDFSIGGTCFEVKCTKGIGNQIRISTLNQLETDGVSALFLVRVRLREDPSGKTLNQLVAELRSNAVKTGSSGPDFDERLLRLGYLDADRYLYEENRFIVSDLYVYEVGPGFPRLTNSTIPAGIVDGSYVLDETSIRPFRRPANHIELALSKRAT